MKWWEQWYERKTLVRGCPKMTGARLARTKSNCSPQNLTALPRYMRVRVAA